MELTAQSKSTDSIVVKDELHQWAFGDLKEVKVLKYLDYVPEVVRAAEMVLKVRILIEPKGGGQQEQTYYATVVQAKGDWKLQSIGLAKP